MKHFIQRGARGVQQTSGETGLQAAGAHSAKLKLAAEAAKRLLRGSN